MLNIVCYRWGDKYGVEYVNRLRAGVSRHLMIKHRFHCITDDPAGLRGDIIPHMLPDNHFHGNWNKLMTFQTDFIGCAGEMMISMDIDMVIVGSLDFLAAQPEIDFVMARNWSRGQASGNGSVYRVRVGRCSYVWEEFIKNPELAIDKYHTKTRALGEQRFLNTVIHGMQFFPKQKIVSFKRSCSAKGHSLFGEVGNKIGLTTARFGTAKIPAGASIIVFHGHPLPDEVGNGRCGRWRRAPFVKEYWQDEE